jgi:predicted lysophospholipase L1 biosynthesis ABC-type transport system permease subunit
MGAAWLRARAQLRRWLLASLLLALLVGLAGGVVLVGLPAVMVSLGTMAHTLITSVQRRRHDLAVLKTLGFVRGQVAATIAWRATTFAVVALCLGLPLGVAAGTVLAANLVAAAPARMASHLRPAAALRSE